MSTLAERLMLLMDNLDMKQTELAEKVGISKQSLYKYLHCKCEPRAEIIARMAVALNTSADYIVGLTNDTKPTNRDEESETTAMFENELLLKYRLLTHDNKIRIMERIETMLEKE